MLSTFCGPRFLIAERAVGYRLAYTWVRNRPRSAASASAELLFLAANTFQAGNRHQAPRQNLRFRSKNLSGALHRHAGLGRSAMTDKRTQID
jgi:hypothetical protein